MADEWDKYAVENDEWEQYATTPKRQFNTIAEAQAAMQEAQINQRNAERDASGIMPYITQPPKMMPDASSFNNTVNAVIPSLLGGGMVGNTILKGGAALVPSIGRQIAAGIGGGAVGGAMAPADNIQQRGVNAGVGAALGSAVPLVSGAFKNIGEAIRKLPTRVSDNKAVQFATKIRQAYTNTKTEAVKKFGGTLEKLSKDNPTKKIDLYNNSTIQDIITDPDLSVEAKNVFNKTPILRDIISGKKTDVTVKEAQDIANYLQFKVPANIKSQHLDITDVINEVKSAQASAFPEEMASLRTEYARIAQPFKDLRSQMKLQNVLSSVDKNFGGAVQRSQLKDLFADNPELLKEMGGYRNAGRLLKGVAIGGGVVGTAIGGKKALELIKGVQ